MRSVSYRYEFSEWSSLFPHYPFYRYSYIYIQSLSKLVYRVFLEESSLTGLESEAL